MLKEHAVNVEGKTENVETGPILGFPSPRAEVEGRSGGVLQRPASVPNRARRSTTALALAFGVVVLSGCGARRLELPTGTGVPFPAHEEAYRSATQACRGVSSMTAEIRVSGRVGRQKVRGRVLAGLSRPDNLRLEGVAPFGAPAFILAASGGKGTLLLPRDPAILEGERPDAILDALIGVNLAPDALLAILAGCPVSGGEPVAGFAFGEELVRVDLAEGGSAFLRGEEDGDWVLLSSVSGPLRVDYSDRSPRASGQLHLWVDAPSAVDLRLQVAGADINVALGPEAFEVNVPARAVPITLDELREAGPLARR
jgi:hypothetical protein